MNEIICSILIGVMVLCALWFIVGVVSNLREGKLERSTSLDTPMPPVEEYQCKHTWKPFPWYENSQIDSLNMCYVIKILKPYVCIHCKEVRTETLIEAHGYAVDVQSAARAKDIFLSKYTDRLKPEPYVKEMIADMQLVDRKKLEIAVQLGMIDKEEDDATVD